MGILVNQSRIARRRRKEVTDGAEHESPSASTQHEELEASELAKAVTQALSELPETYRQVLVAHLQEGKKPRDIARELGRPQGTVRAQLHRGLRLMRDLLPASFSLGFLALLAPHSLAEVRRNVLLEAHRRAAATTGVSSVPRPARTLAAQSVVLGLLVLVAGVAWWSWGGSAGEEVAGLPRDAPKDVDAPVALLETPADDGDLPAEARVRFLPASEQPAAALPTATEGTLVVRVERLTDRSPVEGALVSVIPWGSERWFDQLVEARTGSDGLATFEGVHPGRTGIHIDRGEQARIEIVAGQAIEFLAIIHDAIDVAGAVVDESGDPVASAEVFVCCTDGTRLARPVARTDARGRFALEGVDPEYAVGASAPGFAPSALVRASTPAVGLEARKSMRIRMQRSSRALDGRVLGPDGVAIGGARIRAAPPRTGRVLWRSDGSSEIEAAPLVVESAPDGVFAFRDLPEGALALRVDAPGFAPWHGTLEPRDGRRLDVRLGRGATLSGTLLLTSGAPAAGALVAIGGDEARCDAQGRYELRVTAGEQVLRARSGRFAPVVEERVALLDGERRAWSPRVEPALVIRGVALAIDGTPLRRGLVRAFPETSSSGGLLEDAGPWTAPTGELEDLVQSWTGDGGEFVVPALPGVTHVLEVRKRGHWLGPAAGRVEGVAAGSEGVVVRISGRDAWFDGRIVGSDGRSVGPARIYALPESATASYVVDVEPVTGRFHLGPLLGGTYRLRLCAPGRAPVDLGRYELPKNDTLDVGSLTIDAGGAAEVRGEGPFAVVGAGGLWHALVPVGDGVWCADALLPGTYAVHRGAEDTGVDLTVRAGETARADADI
jgi:hypothetical protein